MKNLSPLRKQKHVAFTLVEALVAVMVVGVALFILVAILMPFVSRPGRPYPKIMKAKLEIADMFYAINAYQSEYGRYPVPKNVEAAALSGKEDITYGGSLLDAVLRSGAATPVNTDVLAILMDQTVFPDGKTPTVNQGHCLNPKQVRYLNAKLTGDNTSPGIGNDMVYRDPWGNPYMISMDLSGDDECLDAFYRKHLISRDKGATGFHGLMNLSDTNGANDAFGFHGRVMVWSFGPDGKADAAKPATASPNKDNILNWD